ncbi:MAG: carboxypeptidase regulatory-like domain-containing protein, partial [Crocinitomicaceae bacterium]
MFIQENKLRFKHLIFIFALTILGCFAHGQNGLQLIRGTITDKQSQQILIGVKVCVLETNPMNCVQSDSKGNYRIQRLKPGRYDIKFSYLGYKEVTIPNVIVSSGKETILDISMEESVNNMREIKITNKKNTLNNQMTTVSGRSFSMEEVNRYAGGRSDPARLAANFAGVSSPDDSRNDLVIRGNSPVGVLWRVEGLNIPNPNHFSTIGTTGGPVSAINTNLLRNSDFMTSAFPAEYGNANAGVFDLGFRNGNTEKRENTFQFGLITGIELMTEGPIKKENGSSYVFAYRYGFPSMAKKLGLPIGTFATPYYQDLSFKINSGQTKLGRFSFFGIGAVSRVNFEHDKIDSTDLFAIPNRDGFFNSQIALGGIKHSIKVNEKSYFLTILGANFGGSSYLQDSISVVDSSSVRTIENLTNRLTYSINSSYNLKINARMFFKTGILGELFKIKLLYRSRENTANWVDYWNADKITFLGQAFAHLKYNFSDNLILNTGLHGQFLTLNNSYSIEPRIGLKYQFSKTSSFSCGYGIHSQM